METAKQNKLRQEVENETKIEQEKAEARKEQGWYKYNNMNPVITEKED